MVGENPLWRLLVFGASGAIGAAICKRAASAGWSVIGSSRSVKEKTPDDYMADWVVYDPVSQSLTDSALSAHARFDAVCWAQGINFSDSLYDFDEKKHLESYQANCLFVLKSAAELLANNLLAAGGARLCVISSIWQERARPNKLSYTMAKAALGGFVRSASVDLARDGHLINAVMPGVLDTPMTMANLTSRQIDDVKAATLFNRLPDLDSVAGLVAFLCSKENSSVTGQAIAVDLGFSNACLI